MQYRGLHVSEIKGGKFASVSSFEPGSFCGQSQGRAKSTGMFEHNDQMDISPSHGSVSPPRDGQELISSYKSSCRLFGFSLTQENHTANCK